MKKQTGETTLEKQTGKTTWGNNVGKQPRKTT